MFNVTTYIYSFLFPVIIRFTIIPLTIIFLFVSCTKEPGGPLIRVSDKSYKSVADAVYETINSQIFFVGEHHDNPHHHTNQLEIIREIHEGAEKPLAIGLEMFETDYQEQLNQWISGSFTLEEFINIYYANWEQAWILYRDIFLYAREHQIPLIALNISRKVVRKVAQQGFASLTSEDLSRLPQGVTCDVTLEYEKFIKRVFGWHGKKNDSFTHFCEAQVLWDAIMAINLLQFTGQNPGTKLVVLAGDGHAWKPGIPRQVSLRQDLPFTVFLPETTKLHRRNVSHEDTDFLWLLQFI